MSASERNDTAVAPAAPGPVAPVRVMIVDDSATYRTLLRSVLGSQPDLEVVAQAINGRLAMPRVRYYRPDVVILDHVMPEMNGLEALEQIRRELPNAAVIMFSSHTKEGAAVTIRALELGAADFVTKPEGGVAADVCIARKLVPRIRALHSRASHGPFPEQRDIHELPQSPPPSGALRPAEEIEYCAVGVSTGGPAALREFVHAIGPEFPGSILIVQHMPPIFTAQLAESLERASRIRTTEAVDGEFVLPGHCYVAPGGRHMTVEEVSGRMRARISDAPPELGCRPSVNVLFRSIAATSAVCRTAAVIMTGMGEDGFLGIQALRSHGARVLAQSRESCLVFGMPARPTREGLVDAVDTPAGLGARVSYLAARRKA